MSPNQKYSMSEQNVKDSSLSRQNKIDLPKKQEAKEQKRGLYNISECVNQSSGQNQVNHQQ